MVIISVVDRPLGDIVRIIVCCLKNGICVGKSATFRSSDLKISRLAATPSGAFSTWIKALSRTQEPSCSEQRLHH
jgi:hypothetical protein